MRTIGASPILGMPYQPDPEKLKAYATKDAEEAVDFYRKAWPEMVRWQKEYEARREWIRQLKANNRRNKRSRRNA